MPARNYTAEFESEVHPSGRASTETPRVQAPKWTAGTQSSPGPDDQNNDAHNDAGLLKKAAAGDGRAFHAVIDRHMDRLYRLAVSLIGNAADAEDVLQEAFAGAYRGIGKFEGRASVGTWLTRIVVTQVAKWRRDRYRRRDLTPIEACGREFSAPEFSAGSGAAGVDARVDVQAALELLSPDHREVLVLREFEQMSYEEIAEALGVPQGTVESRLYRARSELREKLKAYLP